MILWWIGNAVLLFVVIPVVLLCLNRVLRPAKEIESYANDILEHGVGITKALDDVPKLVRTAELTDSARRAVTRYGQALERML